MGPSPHRACSTHQPLLTLPCPTCLPSPPPTARPPACSGRGLRGRSGCHRAPVVQLEPGGRGVPARGGPLPLGPGARAHLLPIRRGACTPGGCSLLRLHLRLACRPPLDSLPCTHGGPQEASKRAAALPCCGVPTPPVLCLLCCACCAVQAVTSLMEEGLLQGGPDYVSLIADGEDWCVPRACLVCRWLHAPVVRLCTRRQQVLCKNTVAAQPMLPTRFPAPLPCLTPCRSPCPACCRYDPTMVRFPGDEAARHNAIDLLVSEHTPAGPGPQPVLPTG